MNNEEFAQLLNFQIPVRTTDFQPRKPAEVCSRLRHGVRKATQRFGASPGLSEGLSLETTFGLGRPRFCLPREPFCFCASPFGSRPGLQISVFEFPLNFH